MATNTILEQALRGKLPEAGDVALDDLRAMLEVLLTRVMEAEVTSRVAAERHERSDERTATETARVIAASTRDLARSISRFRNYAAAATCPRF